jgi:hypothetical protein
MNEKEKYHARDAAVCSQIFSSLADTLKRENIAILNFMQYIQSWQNFRGHLAVNQNIAVHVHRFASLYPSLPGSPVYNGGGIGNTVFHKDFT